MKLDSQDRDRALLESKYRQLHNQQSSSFNDDDSYPSYWSFLKLRIGFSLLLFFFFVASAKAMDSNQSKIITNTLQQMNQRDPYTQKAIETFQNITK